MLIKVLVDGKITHAYFTRKKFLTLHELTESMHSETIFLEPGKDINISVSTDQRDATLEEIL